MTGFQSLMEATNFAPAMGVEFQWDCYPKAQFFDAQSDSGVEVSVVADPVSGIVYEAQVIGGDDAYRWFNPAFLTAHKEECDRRGVAFDEPASEGVKWAVTDAFEDIVSKVDAIWNGKEFDPRVIITIEIETDLRDRLAAQAADLGITMEDHLSDIVTQEFKRLSGE